MMKLLLNIAMIEAGLVLNQPREEVAQNSTVLVLSKYAQSWKNPLVIDVSGVEHTEIDFGYGHDTDLYLSCSVQYQDTFYIFGGLFEPRQVLF